MLKELLGIAPQNVKENIYIPSPLSLKLATSDETDYSHTKYQETYKGEKLRIMMVCTEEENLEMKNGKIFLTGNHPVEMFVPMLHFDKAGFQIDIFTPTGKSAKIEMWAMPEKDKSVKMIYSKYKSNLESPNSLESFVEKEMSNNDNYIGIFIPGGHGALLGLPKNENLKELLHWADDKELTVMSLCHGPAALLAANLNGTSKDFIYKDYTIAAFPDSVDDKTPFIGYLPGKVPWKFGEKLKDLGVNIVNKKADDTCHKDRNLITGASPEAANDFGILASKALLKKIKKDWSLDY